jgi:prepilin-type processing-associated H-X9-DG protein
VDQAEASVTCAAFVLHSEQTGFWYTIPGQRDHGCGANVAFADGHAEFHKWQYLGRKRGGIETPVPPNNPQDAADLAWIVGALPIVRDP